jgi:hypothetical protein
MSRMATVIRSTDAKVSDETDAGKRGSRLVLELPGAAQSAVLIKVLGRLGEPEW